MRALVAGAVATATMTLALASPVLGSAALPGKLRAKASRLFPHSLAPEASIAGEDTLLNVLASRPGLACTVAVPPRLSSGVFAYTGYRELVYVRLVSGLRQVARWRRGAISGRVFETSDLAQVRYMDTYETIATDRRRLLANERLTLVRGDRRRWRDLARAWGVDAVVVPVARSSRRALVGRRLVVPTVGDTRFGVVWLGSCGRG